MTAPYYQDDSVTLYHGDCIAVMAQLEEAFIDAVVTDPPYGLEFMGKEWDAPWKHGFGDTGYSDAKRMARPNFGSTRNPMCRTCRQHQRGTKRCECVTPDYDERPADSNVAFQEWCESWAIECLRVLKPGGHMLAFGGTRTWHRLACAIEDAGFEIRDSIAWLYSQGFPKSMNVGADQRFCRCDVTESGGGHGELRGVREAVSDMAPDAAAGEIANLFASVQRQGAGPGVGDARTQGFGGAEDVHAVDGCCEPCVAGRCDAETSEGELQGRSVCAVSSRVSGDGPQGRVRDGAPASDGAVDRSAATTGRGGQSHRPQPSEQRPVEPGAVSDERGSQARRGWPVCGRCGKQSVVGVGTALKPAHEPIVVARKPLQGTVASNVTEHGTGALNIDGCRIDLQGESWGGNREHAHSDYSGKVFGKFGEQYAKPSNPAGRWPTNVVLDDATAAEVDKQSGNLPGGVAVRRNMHGQEQNANGIYGSRKRDASEDFTYGDSGGASRFFPTFRYEAKADASERPTVNGIAHPTVKPLELMRWLIRLVTPPNGVVLDPFAGSGTTAEACIHEHKRCITIERETDYLPLIVARLTKPMAVGFDFGEAL